MEKQKNYAGIIALLTMIIVILITLVVLFATGAIGVGNKSNDSNMSGEEILDKAIGAWGMCNGERSCYGINIAKDEQKNYIYRPYQVWSDGFYGGNVENIEKTSNYTIRVTVHYNAVHNMLVDIDEYTSKYVIDISKIDKDIIIVDGDEYQKIVGDTETFFNKLSKQKL